MSEIDSTLAALRNGPLSKAGNELIALYAEHERHTRAGGDTPFISSRSRSIVIDGERVGIDVRGSGVLEEFVERLTALEMEVRAVDERTRTVEGLLPIGRLLRFAELPQTIGLSAVHKPRHGRHPGGDPSPKPPSK
jgi:hypothetical protein